MDDCVPDQGLTLYHVKYRNSFNPGKEECTTVDLQEKELVLMDHMSGRRLLKLPYKTITSMYSEGESLGFQCGRGKDSQGVVLATSFSNFMFAYITKRKFGDQEVKIRQSWGIDTDDSDRVTVSEFKAPDNTDDASIKAPDDASIKAPDDASIKPPDDASIKVPDDASIKAPDDASITSYDDTDVTIKSPDNTDITMKKELEHTNVDQKYHPLEQNNPTLHYVHMVRSNTSIKEENYMIPSSPKPNLQFSVLVRENTFEGSSVNGESTLILCEDKLILDNLYVNNEEWFYKYIKNHQLSGPTIEFTCYEKSPMGAGKIVFESENASRIDQILVQFMDTFYVEVSQEDEFVRRFGLKGEYKLIVHYDFLKLYSPDDTLCHYWHYKNIRSYGRKAASFSITCGRGSSTGEGTIAFKTTKWNEIFAKVDGNVKDLKKISIKNK